MSQNFKVLNNFTRRSPVRCRSLQTSLLSFIVLMFLNQFINAIPPYINSKNCTHTSVCLTIKLEWRITIDCHWQRQKKCILKNVWENLLLEMFYCSYFYTLLCSNGSSKMYRWSITQTAKNTCCMGRSCFIMNISSQRQQKMEEADICTTKSLCPLFCGSPLCLKRFKYSSIPQLTLFICVPSESNLAFFTSKQ